MAVEYPVGHRRRRKEGIPLLLEKFENNLRGKVSAEQEEAILELCGDSMRLGASPVHQFMDLFVVG